MCDTHIISLCLALVLPFVLIFTPHPTLPFIHSSQVNEPTHYTSTGALSNFKRQPLLLTNPASYLTFLFLPSLSIDIHLNITHHGKEPPTLQREGQSFKQQILSSTSQCQRWRTESYQTNSLATVCDMLLSKMFIEAGLHSRPCCSFFCISPSNH